MLDPGRVRRRGFLSFIIIFVTIRFATNPQIRKVGIETCPREYYYICTPSGAAVVSITARSKNGDVFITPTFIVIGGISRIDEF